MEGKSEMLSVYTLSLSLVIQKCNGRGNCRPCNRITPCDCNLGFEGRYCETSTSTTRAICSGNNDCVRCIADSSNFVEDCPCQSTAAVSYSRLASDNESHVINGE